jgi:hypothetical protein
LCRTCRNALRTGTLRRKRRRQFGRNPTTSPASPTCMPGPTGPCARLERSCSLNLAAALCALHWQRRGTDARVKRDSAPSGAWADHPRANIPSGRLTDSTFRLVPWKGTRGTDELRSGDSILLPRQAQGPPATPRHLRSLLLTKFPLAVFLRRHICCCQDSYRRARGVESGSRLRTVPTRAIKPGW